MGDLGVLLERLDGKGRVRLLLNIMGGQTPLRLIGPTWRRPDLRSRHALVVLRVKGFTRSAVACEFCGGKIKKLNSSNGNTWKTWPSR